MDRIPVMPGMKMAIAVPEERRTIFGEVVIVDGNMVVVESMLGEHLFDSTTGRELDADRQPLRGSARVIINRVKAEQCLLRSKRH
jgi:hypothetical protein